MRCATVALLTAVSALSLLADKKAAAPPQPDQNDPVAIANGLKYQTGRITLLDGVAVLTVPPSFRYLDSEQSALVLEKVWGNPPGSRPLGMLFPAGVSPMQDNSWGVIITYQDDGYIKDDDAAGLDYDDMLKDMQSDAKEANTERVKQGYEPVELVGWATKPRYDGDAHKLYWAKDLKFGDAKENTLNYNIRVLGRKGVLVLNAVSSMGQLHAVEREMQSVLGMVDFAEGSRYADYRPGMDKVAAYGIGALVAGKVASKVGLIGILLAFGKKFGVLLVAAGAAAAKKLFGGKKAPIEEA